MPSAPDTAARSRASGRVMPSASASRASWLYTDGVANTTVGSKRSIAAKTRALKACSGNSIASAPAASGNRSAVPSP